MSKKRRLTRFWVLLLGKNIIQMKIVMAKLNETKDSGVSTILLELEKTPIGAPNTIKSHRASYK